MHGGAAIGVLVLLFVGIPALSLIRNAARARGSQGQPRAGGGIVTGWLAHRRALRLKRVDHENGTARDKARHEHRLREQAARDRRKAARAAARDPGGTGGDWTREATDQGGFPPPPGTGWRATVTHVWGRWHPAGDAARPGREPGGALGPAAPPAPAPGSSGGHRETTDAPGPVSSPEPPARGSGSPAPPGRPAPGPASPASPVLTEPRPLEGVIVTTLPDTTAPSAVAAAVPGVEEAVEGMRRIHAHARAGNIRAKRRALLALVAVLRHAAVMASAMSRALSEPGQHYGPEVTEPIAMGSIYLSAAASSFSDGDAALQALLRASLDETMRSGRQVPHHGELTETGAR